MNQNGINFNIKNEDFTFITKKLSIDAFNKLNAGKISPIINAIAIDWNEAEVEDNVKIKTTGELLSWIKNKININNAPGNINLNNEQIEALNYVVEFVKQIKNNQQNNDNDNMNNNYYFYVGTEQPTSSTSINNIVTGGTPGWHLIGESLIGINSNNKAHDSSSPNNMISVEPTYTTNDGIDYYIVIPEELNIYDGIGNNITGATRYTNLGNIEIQGHTYKIIKDHDYDFIYNIY